jgi:membrane fusion protein (multidrug efflux system)
MNVQDEKLEASKARSPQPVVEKKIEATRPKGRGRAFIIFFIVLAIAGGFGLKYWLNARQFESTDDAQVEAHLNPISARVEGTITHVYVDNNQIVKAGDPLVDLDPRDFQVALDQVRAQLAQARSLVAAPQLNIPITKVENTTNIAGAEADVANAEAALGAAERDRESSAARVTEAEANSAHAQSDLARYSMLIQKEEVSQQEYDQADATAKAQAANVIAARASLEAAGRTVEQRRAQLEQARSRLAQLRSNAPTQVAIRQAMVKSQQASELTVATQVEQAELRLSYTRITSPVAGIVLKRSAETGAHVSAGQQLMLVAQVGDVWVTANFKETQLRNIRPGQPAKIHIDALQVDFDGFVENIGGGTGAVSSVLPPENATGNYVKVVQRIPVRIRFQPNQPGLDRLRLGMSVEPQVHIGG